MRKPSAILSERPPEPTKAPVPTLWEQHKDAKLKLKEERLDLVKLQTQVKLQEKIVIRQEKIVDRLAGKLKAEKEAKLVQ